MDRDSVGNPFGFLPVSMCILLKGALRFLPRRHLDLATILEPLGVCGCSKIEATRH